MSIDKKFLNLFTKVTEKAAIGASKFIGKKDKIAADQGAVDEMRNQLNKITISSVTRSNKQNVDSIHFENHSSKNYILNGLLLKDLTKLNLDLYSNNGFF